MTALKFKMRRVALLPEPNKEQGKLFPELDDMPLVVRELKEAGTPLMHGRSGSRALAMSMRKRGLRIPRRMRMQPLSSTSARKSICSTPTGLRKVDNSTGFLLQAIRQNYANPEFAQELRREASAATQQAKRERQKQVKMLEQQKADLEKARDREFNQLRDQVAAESPDVLEQAAAELLAIDKGFSFCISVISRHWKIINRGPLSRHSSTLTWRSMIPPALKPSDNTAQHALPPWMHRSLPYVIKSLLINT